MKKEIDVVAAFIKKENKVLLCQRNKDDFYANLWEFPGGGIEPGESKTTAIEREIFEETNLLVKAKNLIHEFFDENETLKIKVFLFLCKIEQGKAICQDCQDLGFFSADEAEKLKLAPVDRKIFKHLEEENLI